VSAGVLVCLICVTLLFAACGRSPQSDEVKIVATPGLAPTPTHVPLTPTPTSTPSRTPTPSATPAGWESVGEGVQIRRSTGLEDGRTGDVYALRLDPSRVDVRLAYDPDRPRTVAEWFVREQALAVLNAAFFDGDYSPVGLWVIDGETFGRGHRLMQGEFRVSGAGLSILRVNQRHLTDGTRIIASVESYPVLLNPGGVVNSCLVDDSLQVRRFHRRCANLTDAAARLVVGIDGAGHLMFILIPSETFTLPGLAEWLKRSDFNLDVALNLDGGSSAGMLVRAGERIWGEDSRREVPGALIVLPKVLGIQSSEPP
jgi:uncharacterized protein YigE (DUF2233 family)